MDRYEGQDVRGWQMSEKLDGVFARWNGSTLFGRDWTVLTPPAWLCANLPAGEGEIWHPAGLERVQAVRTWSPDSPQWDGVRFVPHLSIPTRTVRDHGDVDAFFAEVVERGGEGIVLRNPYSGETLKLKPSNDDEAEVIGYTAGSGRNTGVGSLRVRWGGKEFRLSVGLSSSDRSNPPPVGAVVTFAFDGLTARGLPRNARFLRVRVAA